MLESLRNDVLIEERLAYEENYFTIFAADIEKSNEIDIQVSQQFDVEEYFPEIDYYNCHDPFEEIFYLDYDSIDSVDKCYGFLDYMPHDDLYDSLDCYDYPEGPDENLNGFNPFPQEECFFDFDPIDEPDFVDYGPIDEYEDSENSRELHMQKLIEQHLSEEKEFMDSILQCITNELNA